MRRLLCHIRNLLLLVGVIPQFKKRGMFITFLLSRMVGVGLSVWMFALTYRELVLRLSVIASFFLSILVVWLLHEPANAHARRELPNCEFHLHSEPQAGGDAVARRVTHPGLLCCEL